MAREDAHKRGGTPYYKHGLALGVWARVTRKGGDASAELRGFLQQIDTNADGSVTWEEYLAWVQGSPSEQSVVTVQPEAILAGSAAPGEAAA